MEAVDLHGRGLGEDDISVRCLVNEATADAGDGDLPSDAETLASLTALNISHNNLRAVPDAVIDFCEALRVLDLAGNRIGFRGRTLPRTITRLVSLEDLSVAENSLQSLPTELGSCTNLVRLNARENRLGRLPDLSSLVNVEYLMLDSNDLDSEAVRSIAHLPRLTHLYLDKNSIAALPATIGTLTALASLTLQSNHLEVLPKAVSKLVNLVDLVVDDNELGTFPGVLANCTALEWISATSNLLTGIPTVVLKLPSLTWLDARNNHIESVPKKMSTLTNLRSLTLELNPLSLAKPDVFRAMADAGINVQVSGPARALLGRRNSLEDPAVVVAINTEIGPETGSLASVSDDGAGSASGGVPLARRTSTLSFSKDVTTRVLDYKLTPSKHWFDHMRR